MTRTLRMTALAGVNPVEPQKTLKGADHRPTVTHWPTWRGGTKADSGLVEKLEGLGKDRFEGPDDVRKAVFHTK